MRKLPTRQVHLDFHTSPSIEGVGRAFDKAQFQEALRQGCVNSITVFAKCHHGMCYYPTGVGTPHPGMAKGQDLTGDMIAAAHEIGVAAPVYITVGFSALDAERHPEWCMRRRDGSILSTNVDENAAPEDPRPFGSWRMLCPSGDYAEHIYALTQEIVQRYDELDGLFYDIVYPGDVCYCETCLAGMKSEGLNPDNAADAREYYRRNHLRFMARCDAILHARHPDATLFFNSGGAEIYRPEYHAGQTHYEMEDLPTAWGGYDKMPARASFMSRYADKEYLGMTGKFHAEWGEFGGYKNPDALRYETLLMAAYGAKCSVGDQLHPSGKMDMETYRLIGHAYRAVQAVEPWCYPAQSTATLGVYLSGDEASDNGLHRMLLEAHVDFDVVMPGDDLTRFEALALPDSVRLTAAEAARLNAFSRAGGALIFSGQSALENGAFQIDPGASYQGAGAYRMDYLCPTALLPLPFGNAPFLCYESACRTALTDGLPLALIYEPLFDRTYAHYCSHRNTPYGEKPSACPGVVQKGKTIYFAHPIFRLYHIWGEQLLREAFTAALFRVYTPRYRVRIGSMGRTRLTSQPEAHRLVLHAAYASPVQRGRFSVLEDMPAWRQVAVEIAVRDRVRAVHSVPDGASIPFTQENSLLRFEIPCVACHQAVEILFDEGQNP